MTTLDVGIAALRSSLSALRSAASRSYELYDRTSATLKAVMPKGLYARALLIIIAPMVVLSSPSCSWSGTTIWSPSGFPLESCKTSPP
jgi:two-component system, OmpR family, osmolarity sensor histidine kinase EnvZ